MKAAVASAEVNQPRLCGKPVSTLCTPPFFCGEPAETVDMANGFRCAEHPPGWNREYERSSRKFGRPGVAGSYRRTVKALLTQRVLARAVARVAAEPEEEAT